jgi:hypothetical protein
MFLEFLSQFIAFVPDLWNRIVKSGHCQPEKALLSLFPALVWLPKYEWKKNITSDIVAGFTVAIVHIPQGNTSFVIFNFAFP